MSLVRKFEFSYYEMLCPQLIVSMRNGVLGAAVTKAAMRDLEGGPEISCSRQKEEDFHVQIAMIYKAATHTTAQVQRLFWKQDPNLFYISLG